MSSLNMRKAGESTELPSPRALGRSRVVLQPAVLHRIGLDLVTVGAEGRRSAAVQRVRSHVVVIPPVEQAHVRHRFATASFAWIVLRLWADGELAVALVVDHPLLKHLAHLLSSLTPHSKNRLPKLSRSGVVSGATPQVGTLDSSGLTVAAQHIPYRFRYDSVATGSAYGFSPAVLNATSFFAGPS